MPDPKFLKQLRIGLPIIQAPMAGADSVDLAAEVSAAGGLGSLACASLKPMQIHERVLEFRGRTQGPIHLNFFCHPAPPESSELETCWKTVLKPYYREFGIELASPASGQSREPFTAELCPLIEELKPEIVSFHFGLPESGLVAWLKSKRILILSTATSVREARWLEERGCDAIIAQGFEAGGHRGMFLETDSATQTGTMALVPQVVDAVEVPVIAAGQVATAIRNAQAQPETDLQELYDFFMQAPAPLVILLGPEHRFSLANPPYERFVGRKVAGKTVLEAFTFEEVGAFVEHLDTVYKTGVPYVGRELPLSLPDEDGMVQHRYIDVGYHPFREHDGTIKGVLAIHQDVTEQVMARQNMEKLTTDLQSSVHARDEFLSIASHELKTPLTSIKLQLQMTRRRINPELGQVPPADKLAAAIDMSLRQTGRLAELVDDLLDVSRIQAGKLVFDFNDVEVGSLIQEVVDRHTEQLERANCLIVADIENGLKARWDRSRIEQILVNLLSNAIKYAPGKPIFIRARAQGGLVSISVQDLGPGIPRALQSKIFDRFERASASRNISGLGLGLYIVKQIVKGHRGSVKVESTEGVGTTFIVDLPLFPAI